MITNSFKDPFKAQRVYSNVFFGIRFNAMCANKFRNSKCSKFFKGYSDCKPKEAWATVNCHPEISGRSVKRSSSLSIFQLVKFHMNAKWFLFEKNRKDQVVRILKLSNDSKKTRSEVSPKSLEVVLTQKLSDTISDYQTTFWIISVHLNSSNSILKLDLRIESSNWIFELNPQNEFN